MKNKNIKVIGIGGGGSSAVNYLLLKQIDGLSLGIINTDKNILELASIKNKLQIGVSGLGAGMDPEVGRKIASENEKEIGDLIGRDTDLLILIAGFGKGTGTGATQVVADVAKKLNKTTIAIITFPFFAEGPKRREQSEKGILELSSKVDSLLVIKLDDIREKHGNLPLSNQYDNSHEYIYSIIKSLLRITFSNQTIGLDYNDFLRSIKGHNVLLYGTGSGEGKNRGEVAARKFIEDFSIDFNKVNTIILEITTGIEEATLDEVSVIQEKLTSLIPDVNILWTVGTEEQIGKQLIIDGFLSSKKIVEAEGKGLSLKKAISKDKSEKFEENNYLNLFFSLKEYTKDEVSEIISNISDLYKSIGGDKIVIKGINVYEPQTAEIPY